MGRTIWYSFPDMNDAQLSYLSQGDTVYIEALGTPVLILNSHSNILAALEKKGSNFSHRPTLTVVGELIGLDQVCNIIHHISQMIY